MLIGLHGKARSGKDTALGFIDEYFANTATTVEGRSFAAPLKLGAARLFYPTADLDKALDFSDWLKTRGEIQVIDTKEGDAISHITGRQFLQRYGTESHRDVFSQDFWVKTCLPDGVNHGGRVIVVTDVRFANEAERVRELGGVVWHIIRPESENGDTHASEQPLPPELIDVTIDNDRDLLHFQGEVNDALTFDSSLRGDPTWYPVKH